MIKHLQSAKMHGQTGSWNFQRPGVNYTRYTENMEWNQNFRPLGPRRGNIETCDYQHWCETCDKGFATVHFLENHKLQHQKCSIDGCQFVAHPKIITKHIQMQHSTGIFKRIAKLNNPEDIEKWREERKRKYPTIENIKKKEAGIKEKINRGEKMGMKNERRIRNDKTEFHHKSNQRPAQTGKAKHPQEKYIKNIANNRKRVATDVTKRSNLSKKICKAIPPVEESRTLKPFAGIQSLQIEDLDVEIESQTQCSIPIEDDEDIDSADTEQNDTSVLEPSVCSALTSLMCCYESSDEDDVKTNTQGIELKKPLNENKTRNKNNDKLSSPVNQTNSAKANCAEKVSENTNIELQDSERIILNGQGASDDESGPEEVKISKEDISMPVDNTQILKTRPTKELSAKNINRPPVKKYEYRKRNKLPSTLLEKLLHREIQHERNVILQCVRYVVKNKYFENS